MKIFLVDVGASGQVNGRSSKTPVEAHGGTKADWTPALLARYEAVGREELPARVVMCVGREGDGLERGTTGGRSDP